MSKGMNISREFPQNWDGVHPNRLQTRPPTWVITERNLIVVDGTVRNIWAPPVRFVSVPIDDLE